MNDKQIMISLWVGLICLVPVLVFGLYQERSEYFKQCAEANGTLITTRSDYICVKTNAIIPLK